MIPLIWTEYLYFHFSFGNLTTLLTLVKLTWLVRKSPDLCPFPHETIWINSKWKQSKYPKRRHLRRWLCAGSCLLSVTCMWSEWWFQGVCLFYLEFWAERNQGNVNPTVHRSNFNSFHPAAYSVENTAVRNYDSYRRPYLLIFLVSSRMKRKNSHLCRLQNQIHLQLKCVAWIWMSSELPGIFAQTTS